MKNNASFIIIALFATVCSACSIKRTEVMRNVVNPTCISEGYTEHVLNDGYTYRDNFKEKIPHQYFNYEINGENSISYSICSYCGKLEEYDPVDFDISTEVVIDRNRIKPSFVNHDHMAVSIIREISPEQAIKRMRKSEMHGAHGFMVYLSDLRDEYQNLDDIERIMYCTDLPVLAIAYENIDLLRLGVEAGACAVDMPGYLFDDYSSIPTKNKGFEDYYVSNGIDVSFVESDAKEIALDPIVVEEQREFIDEMHNLGAEVLYSAHVQVEMNSSQIISAANFMRELGVDVAKIVCAGSSKETVIEHLKAIITLEQELGIKFSVHGESVLSRIMGPMFGSYIAFCIDEKDINDQTNLQVDLEMMSSIIDYLELFDCIEQDS